MRTNIFVPTLAVTLMLGSAAFAQTPETQPGNAPKAKTQNCVGANCRAVMPDATGTSNPGADGSNTGRSSTSSPMGGAGNSGNGSGAGGAGSGAGGAGAGGSGSSN